MSENRLNVVYTDNNQHSPSNLPNSRAQREEIQAIMERLWRKDPEQFNPLRDSMGRKRIQNTFEAIQLITPLNEKKIVDLGCGSGVFSRKLRDAGSHIDAVDVASQAIQRLKSQDTHHITAIQDCLPSTKLNDQAYDIVICTEIIGYLKFADYRMFMAELSRLVKRDGYVVCSTQLDINTYDPLDRFVALAETEFTIDKWLISYHLLQIRLCNFFEAPAYYVKCANDVEYRQQELNKREGFSRKWLLINSKKPSCYFWSAIGLIFNLFAKFFRQNTVMMNFLERITKFFWSDAGISHALFIGKRRPLTFPVKSNEVPREIKHKRQVWE